jgi:hypothetical protein
MVSDIVDKEQKNSSFETTDKENFLFNVFLGFQTLLLLSVYVFSWVMKCGYIGSPDINTTLWCIIGLTVIFFIYYIFKRSIFNMLLYISAETEEQKMLRIKYKSLFQLWGVFLYIPVFWILLVGEYIFYATILLIISYIFSKIILAYRFIFIFFSKNIWLLFLNLYLCAQEIIPLLFLYKGLICIYNIIDKNNIWQ